MRFHTIFLVSLLGALMVAGCADSPANEKDLEATRTELRLVQMQAEIDRLREPHILVDLQESGCTEGAELYRRMMRGEFVAGSRQGMLCTALRTDARGFPACERLSHNCEVALCEVEPHQGCVAQRDGDMDAYPRLKAPVPSADRQ